MRSVKTDQFNGATYSKSTDILFNFGTLVHHKVHVIKVVRAQLQPATKNDHTKVHIIQHQTT